MRKNHYFDNKRNQCVGLNFCSELLLYRTIASNVNGIRMQKFHGSLVLFLCVFLFFFFFLQFHTPAWEERGQSLFLSAISTQSETFRNFFVVLHLRLLPSIINHSRRNCQILLQQFPTDR